MTMQSEITRLEPGSLPPEVELVGVDGEPVRLATLWARRPLVLVLFGDLNSPFTGDQAVQIRDACEVFEEIGAGVAAVCSATPESVTAFHDAWSLHYDVFADEGNAAHDAYGVTGSGVFVIDTAGVVRLARVSEDLAGYPPTTLLFASVCAITGAKLPEPPEPTPLPAPAVSGLSPGMASKIALRGAPDDPVTGSYACAKCSCVEYATEQVSTAGGFVSRLFNLQHRKFTAVTCQRCGYTELYKRVSGTLGNIVDLLAR